MKTITPSEVAGLLNTLENRFEKNRQRHTDIKWEDVKAKLLKGYNQFGKETFPLSDCMIFKNGANIFPPQFELKYYIDKPQDIDYSSDDSFIELELAYSDMHNQKFNQNIFKLPFNQIGGNYSDPPERYLGQIPYYLKKLNANIEKLKK